MDSRSAIHDLLHIGINRLKIRQREILREIPDHILEAAIQAHRDVQVGQPAEAAQVRQKQGFDVQRIIRPFNRILPVASSPGWLIVWPKTPYIRTARYDK